MDVSEVPGNVQLSGESFIVVIVDMSDFLSFYV